MAEVILMPRLSDTMTEGVIAAWHKKIGDTVKKGDLLAEIETDKATMDLESYKDGVLLHSGAEKGGKLQVNDLLAIIGEKGEDISQYLSGGSSAAAAEQPAQQQSAATEAQPKTEAPAATNNNASSGGSMDLSKIEEVVLMPRLSDTMTDGVIASWNKKVGDEIKKGELLAEIETDKATMELESYKNGKVLYIGAQAGEKIAVNELLCIIGEEGKVDVDKIVAAAKGGTAPAATSEGETQKAPEASAPAQQAETSAAPANNTSEDGRIKASPLAKKLAQEKGIDIAQVQGSGDNGRIVKKDVDSFTPAAKESAAPQQKAAASASVAQPQVTGRRRLYRSYAFANA